MSLFSRFSIIINVIDIIRDTCFIIVNDNGLNEVLYYLYFTTCLNNMKY